MRADNGADSVHHCLHALHLSALLAARCRPRRRQVVPQRKNSIGRAANLSVRQKIRPPITEISSPHNRSPAPGRSLLVMRSFDIRAVSMAACAALMAV